MGCHSTKIAPTDNLRANCNLPVNRIHRQESLEDFFDRTLILVRNCTTESVLNESAPVDLEALKYEYLQIAQQNGLNKTSRDFQNELIALMKKRTNGPHRRFNSISMQ